MRSEGEAGDSAAGVSGEQFVHVLRALRHELLTPLNQIIGYAEMLNEDAVEAGDDALALDLQKIGSAGSALAARLDELFGGGLGAMVKSAAEPAAPAQRTQHEQAATQSECGHILVVDDVEANRDLLARRLRRSGYATQVAAGGEEALRYLGQQPCDLVLLDIDMPGMDGLAVLERLRADPAHAELPVIMATAKDASEDVVRALEAGANDYVTKPLDFPVVLARVATQLRLKRALEEARHMAMRLELHGAFVRRVFGRYVSDEVVETVLQQPEGLNVGGERREVSILFADLRGFTAISSQLPAETVVGMLNHYLEQMVEVVLRYHGTIKEFTGDGLLVLFGAPVACERHAERAVACALDMQRAMPEVNAWNLAHDLPTLAMGIGINSGEAVAGSIGSSQRSSYAVVGQTVNLAARVESITVGGEVCISQATYQRVGVDLLCRGWREVALKGAAEPLRIADVTGIGGPYQLRLSEVEECERELSPAATLSLSLLNDKLVENQQDEAVLLRASAGGGVLCSERDLGVLSGVRLSFCDLPSSMTGNEIYAKVSGPERGVDHGYRVRFTAVGAAAREHLSALLADKGA